MPSLSSGIEIEKSRSSDSPVCSLDGGMEDSRINFIVELSSTRERVTHAPSRFLVMIHDLDCGASRGI
jgi:hypothetical protein